MFFSLELMEQLLPNLDRSLFWTIEFSTEIKLKFKGHKGQKRPGFRALTALLQKFYFYYEFLHVIVHKSGFNFFGKGVRNKASQGQVPGLAGLYGLWKQDIVFGGEFNA